MRTYLIIFWDPDIRPIICTGRNKADAFYKKFMEGDIFSSNSSLMAANLIFDNRGIMIHYYGVNTKYIGYINHINENILYYHWNEIISHDKAIYVYDGNYRIYFPLIEGIEKKLRHILIFILKTMPKCFIMPN